MRARKVAPRGLLAGVLAAVVIVVLVAEHGPIRDSYVPAFHRDHALIVGPGIDLRRHTIAVGALLPLTGPGSAAGKALLEGARYALRSSRRSRALGGWQVTLAARDTRGRNARQQQLFPSLAHHVAMLGLTYGLAATAAILPRARRFGFMTIAADARYMRFMRDPSIAVLGAPYSVDAANAIAAAAEGTAPVGFVDSGGALGEEARRGYQVAVAHDPRLRGATVRLGPTRGAAASVIRALRSTSARSVLVADPDTASTAGLLLAAQQARYAPRWLLVGPAWSPGLVAAAPAQQLHRVRVLTATALIAQRAALGLRRLPASRRGLFDRVAEGAAIAHLIVAIVKRALADRDVSPRGLLDARLRLGRVALAGLMAAYHASPWLPIGTRQSLLAAVDEGAPDHLRLVRGFFTTPAGEALTFAAS
jgi:ABC-type branched-subunit amino acid transport system substrate-binding protein